MEASVAERTKQAEYEMPDFEGAFDYSLKYPDNCYAAYIDSFVPNRKRRLLYRFIKRTFDVLLSALLLVLFSPVFLVIIVAIKCDSKGPAIFKGKRMGRNGKIFTCYKFRTMSIDAPEACATSLLKNPAQYQTRLGRQLRRFSLDELPQLWCVLIGTMSFIGYRPLVLTEEKCNDMRNQLYVFSARPGISGYAQVRGRDNVYYKNKAIMDSIYVKNASLSMDCKLILQTVAVVLRREGNDAERNK